MKLCILYTCITLSVNIIHASININNKTHTGTCPTTTGLSVVTADRDTQVVSESMGTMVQALVTFSQNSNNPIVAGACALQALGAFIKMLIQIFDEVAPTRRQATHEEIELRFLKLPKEKQLKVMQLLLAYIQIRTKTAFTY